MNDLSTIKAALAFIPPHDRDTWVMVGMALQSELGQDGFNVWDEWAAAADNHNERDSLVVWRSFKPGKTGIGSFFHEAKAHGWKPMKPLVPLSEEEKADLERLRVERQQRAEQAEIQRQADNERKAELASRLWDEALPLEEHPYLARKGVQACGAVKVQYAERLTDGQHPLTSLTGLCLILPIQWKGQIIALQVIQSDGERRFIGSPKGGALMLGMINNAVRILIAEGYITASSLHEATGLPVVCAFSASNLLEVAQRLRELFPGVELVLCADNDAHGKGQQKALEAAQAVGGYIALPDFSNAPEGEAKTKASDFNDLHQLVGLDAVAQQVGEAQLVEAPGLIKPAIEKASFVDRVEIIRAADIAPEPIRWLWEGWLARGKLVIMAGAPGTGKTTLAMKFAAAVSTGGTWPDGTSAHQGNVLVWSGEDDPRDTLVPRLHAAGADLSRIFFVGDTVPAGAESRNFDPARDLAALTRAIAGVIDAGEIRLLIVDPIVSAVAGDSHKNAEVRRALAPLVELAVKLDCALLGISHFSKGTQGRDPHERVTGSIAFSALARLVMATAKTKDEEGSPGQILVRVKSNIGPDHGGFRYDFEQTELVGYPGVFASRAQWGDALEGDAKELLDSSDDTGNTDIDDWLRDVLAAGPMKKQDVERLGKANGFSSDQLQRSKTRLGVEHERVGFGKNAAYWWKLPAMPRTEHHVAHAAHSILHAPHALHDENAAKIGPQPDDEAETSDDAELF